MNSGIRISNRQVIVFVAAMVLFSQVCLAKYSGGAGTSEDPYQIATAADLLALRANTTDYDANFVLTADINLSAAGLFTTAVIAHDANGVSFDGNAFTGIFDGNSHTISNLTINTGGSGNNYLGLFGLIGSGGKIENLRLENFSITGGNGSAFIGGLAGEDAGTISSCFSESDVTGGNNSFYIGGLVGVEVNDGNIIDSYSAGTVSGGNDVNYIGGLAGGIYINGDISGCFSTSDVTGGNNSSYIGGLVGKNYLGSIVNCFSTGTVTNEATCFSLGGLVGINFWGSIENCYSTGTVFVEVNNADIGGLVGTNLTYAGGFILSSYFLDIAGPNNGIGTLLTDTQMKQQASFAGWDFNSVWRISESLNYPELAWHFICTSPSAPTGVSATDGTYSDHIIVIWNSAPGATGYEVWRGTDSNSSLASKLGDSNSPFDDSNVTAGTPYYYWVKATNTCGTSGFSSSDSGYVSCPLPSVPTGVSATDGTYSDHIIVTWNSASGATGYEVWRNTSNNSGSALKLGDYTSPFDDFGVTTGTTYYYWVKATNTCGTSGFSSSDSGYATPSCTVPSAPTGVSATDGTYSDHIRVTWNSASGATGYEVWRNTSNNSGSALKLGDYTSPFDDSNVTSGTYYYWVKAKNTCGTSGFSSSDSGYISLPCTVPSAPTGVSATDGVYSDHIIVTWNSASGATGYEVWRNTSNNSGSALKLGDYTSPFDDFGVTTGTTYYYWVKATNTCGTSGFSSSDSGYATPSCTVPSAPTGVSATDGTYSDHIRVTWNSASGATGYEVWRNTSNNSGSALKLGDYTSPFDDSGVATGMTYYYWVKAKNTCGTSGFSSSNSGYVSTNPQTVSIIKCTVTAGSKVNSDKISFSGMMDATADDFNDVNKSSDTNFIEVIISSEDMAPCVFTFPVNGKTWKKGKFSSTITSKPSKMSFAFDTKKTKFSFSASNVDLTGLSCPVGIEIKVGNWIGTAQVDEAIVNGTKPIPINLLMGVEDSLRVDKSKFTKKSGVITQVAVVSGGFSVGNLSDANMATHSCSVTVGSQTFTIPAGNFKAGKNKFTCSKVKLYDVSLNLIGIASATFDFNKCTFTLTIKSTNFTAAAGAAVFGIDFASFSGRDVVTLP